jgi:predicted O-methyltransferase YrrM
MPGLNLKRRRALYSSRTLRELAAALGWTLHRGDAPDLAHLAFYDEITTGPLQRDEALLLHALVRIVRAKTVVEIGFHVGQSAYNFLAALDDDARLYTFDIDPRSAEVARLRFGKEPRVVFRNRPQQEIVPGDVDGRLVDLVFIDGSHDLELNQRLFERLVPMLNDHAIVAVHDTGTTPGKFIPEWRDERKRPERWLGDEYEPQPDERAFVNWILDEHPEFAQIHLHTTRWPRYGITLLQRSERLPRPAASPR